MVETNWTVFQEKINQLSIKNQEPQWMLDLRLASLQLIADLDLPFFERVKISRWPLLTIQENNQVDNELVTMNSSKKNQGYIEQHGNFVTQKNLPDKYAQQGVIFTDIQDALCNHSEKLKEGFMKYAVKHDEDKLTAFHAAFMNGGVFVYVPKNVVIEEPLETLFVSTDGEFVKHVLIIAEENSELTYLERYQSEEQCKEAISANIVVEVIAKSGAKVHFSGIDQFGENVTAYINRRGYLERDASIDWALGVLNDGDVIADFDSDLHGEGSHAEIKAVAISSGKQTQGIDTRVTNKAPYSIGHILQHGVVLDKGTLTFNGIGHILKGAKGADAQQESRLLMLSSQARGDANPILLIDENDVTAGHAASVGRVDPDEMYYMMSRGIPKDVAEKLVIRGFLGSILSSLPVKDVRDEIIEVIEGKLG